MPADIFGARFYGHRVPAWHRVGKVSTDAIGAVEAFQRVGTYDVVLDPHAGWSELFRLPTPEDKRRVSFGRVGEDYVLIAPDELTCLWDEHVQAPVETLGVISRGECMFITMRMGDYAVRGDRVRQYLVLAHWMSARRISGAFISPVRVVCSNTLMAAERMASCQLDLRPVPGLREGIGKDLDALVDRAQMSGYKLRKSFERMADRSIGRAEAAVVASAAYPNDVALRQAAMRLFDGAGTGLDLPATRGTLWGMYNAVAELENFRGGGTEDDIATDILFGRRAMVMGAAFNAALALCNSSPTAQTPVELEAEVREPQLALTR